MGEMTKYSFSELYDMSSGISSTAEQAGHGFPFVSFSTVFNNYFIPEELSDLMNTSEKEQETYSIKKDDILLTRTSETIDELAFSCVALKDFPHTTYSGFTKRLRPNSKGKELCYSKYMAFYLRSYLFRKLVTNNAFMTLRASFNETIFSFLYLYLPEYSEQVKIGNFLYNIEQKIETNNKINKELEAMAKTLYDYWFVQFDFPNEDGKPYKSSGGKMEYNKKLKREIPLGWEVVKVQDAYDVCYGYPFNSELFTDNQELTPVVRIRDILESKTSTYTSETTSEKYLLKSEDLLIGMDGNFHMNFWSENRGYLNQRCVRVRKHKDFSLLQAYFSSMPYIKAREKNVSRTTVGHLSAKDIAELYILKPNEELRFLAVNTLDPLLKKLCSNKAQNLELTKLRDWLLPMLMNGQVKVEGE